MATVGPERVLKESFNDANDDKGEPTGAQGVIGSFESVSKADVTDIKIPRPSTKTFRDNQAWYDYLASLTPYWDRLVWYMYRTWPQIYRPDQQKYIDCRAESINEDWILKNHGSGDYMFILNDANKPKNAKEVCKAHIKINNPDYEPMVRLDELDTQYKGNRQYVDRLVAQGKLTPEGRPVSTQTPVANPNDPALVGLLGRLIDKMDKRDIGKLSDPTDTAINKAFEVMARGNQAATEMMLAQMKQEDPDKLIKLVTMVMALIPKVEPAPIVKQDDGVWKLLLETQNKNFEGQMKLMEKIVEISSRNKGEGGDEDDKLDKFMDRMMKFNELMGMGGGGGKKSTLETIMQYAAPAVVQALGTINNILALKAQNPGAAQVESGTALANKGGAIDTTATEVTQVGEQMKQQNVAQQAAIIQSLKAYGDMIVAAVNRGEQGDAFGESIDRLFGPESGVYTGIAALGEDKMIEYLKTDPQLWGKLAPVEARLRVFIQEFIKYGSPDDEAEEGKEKGAENV